MFKCVTDVPQVFLQPPVAHLWTVDYVYQACMAGPWTIGFSLVFENIHISSLDKKKKKELPHAGYDISGMVANTYIGLSWMVGDTLHIGHLESALYIPSTTSVQLTQNDLPLITSNCFTFVLRRRVSVSWYCWFGFRQHLVNQLTYGLTGYYWGSAAIYFTLQPSLVADQQYLCRPS